MATSLVDPTRTSRDLLLAGLSAHLCENYGQDPMQKSMCEAITV